MIKRLVKTTLLISLSSTALLLSMRLREDQPIFPRAAFSPTPNTEDGSGRPGIVAEECTGNTQFAYKILGGNPYGKKLVEKLSIAGSTEWFSVPCTVHAMKVYRRSGVQFQLFLTSSLDAGEWLTSCPGKNSGTH